MESLTDEKIVELYLAKSGSSAAEPYLNELFQRHQSRVASWCLRMTGEVNSAADLAQEIFLKVFQRLASFQGNAKFTTWLYAITRNHCLDALRAKAARPQESSEDLLEEIVDLAAGEVSSALEQRESVNLLRQLIQDSLDTTEIRVVTLHYVQEMPLDSISRLLELTNRSGAKAYIVSARRKLKRAFDRRKRSGPATKGSERGNQGTI
jgi:RNA polymerase sigma factor (sigma-70 family)